MILTYLFAGLIPWVRGKPNGLLVLGSANVDEWWVLEKRWLVSRKGQRPENLAHGRQLPVSLQSARVFDKV